MMINNKCLFVTPKGTSLYFLSKKYGFQAVEPYQLKNRWAYRFRYLFHLLKIDGFWGPFSELSNELQCSRPEMIVIDGSLIFAPFLKRLRVLFPDVRVKYMYSNIVKCNASISPKVLNRYNIEGWSWDIGDCETYSLKYQRPSFDQSLILPSEIQEYHACFIGQDKGRYHVVKDIQAVLEGLGYKCYIKIMPNYNFLLKLREDYSPRIPYSDYLKVVSKSKCIIDLVQKGQTGTTMRVLEAIFSHKKLITNNDALIGYDFYNKNNIFIWGRDSVEDLKMFIESDFIEIEQEVLSEYTPSKGFERILHD